MTTSRVSNSRNRSHPLESRTIRIYLWLMLGVVVTIQSFGVWRICIQEQQLCDFGRFYYAATNWRHHGTDLFLPNFATAKVIDGKTFEMPNVASPVWHLVVWPFTYLPPTIAFIVWVALNIAAWASSLRICLSQWKLDVDNRWYGVIALGILGSSLTAGAFHTGQYVGLLMLPATLAWRSAREERWWSAGACLGVLAYNKPFVLVFLAWMPTRRKWRGVIAATVVMAASMVLGELVFGPGIHHRWRTTLQDDVTAWTWLQINASVWAPWARAFGPSPTFAYSQEPELALVLGLACAGTVALITAWRLRRLTDTDSVWAILWAAALLISPLGWTYYLWWGAGPFGGVILRLWQGQRGPRWLLWAVAGCFWLPLSTVLVGQPSIFASFVTGSIFTWALVAFWMVILRDARTRA